MKRTDLIPSLYYLYTSFDAYKKNSQNSSLKLPPPPFEYSSCTPYVELYLRMMRRFSGGVSIESSNHIIGTNNLSSGILVTVIDYEAVELYMTGSTISGILATVIY